MSIIMEIDGGCGARKILQVGGSAALGGTPHPSSAKWEGQMHREVHWALMSQVLAPQVSFLSFLVNSIIIHSGNCPN